MRNGADNAAPTRPRLDIPLKPFIWPPRRSRRLGGWAAKVRKKGERVTRCVVKVIVSAEEMALLPAAYSFVRKV